MLVNATRSVLRDLAIALGILALVITGLLALASFRGRGSDVVMGFQSPVVAPPLDMEPIIIEEPEEVAISRYVVDSHTVIFGESFSLITGMYWDDIFLWPDLYVHNDLKSGDPDLIYPDEIVDIYNRLGKGDHYSETEVGLILDAYIQVYERFKSLGPHKDGSAWTLLWCGAKYNHDFLDLYAHRIDPEDLAVARRYIAEEGYLD